jgi:hypothetical protein
MDARDSSRGCGHARVSGDRRVRLIRLLKGAWKAAGGATDAAGGQWISTPAGSLSGSLRTMTSTSVLVMVP